MIQQEYKNNVQSTQGTIETSGFTIEVNESMFQMLTSNVYNDPKLAVMREWSTNACDACIAANKEIKFHVNLPTLEEPTFYVRDYGTGLAPEDIKGLFSNLGASTKRNSNAYNGTFGIGRMAGLAVSDAFTVESFYNGSHYSYLISMQNGVPVTMFLGVNETTEENGLKLSIPVPTSDISTYYFNASKLYKYFDHKPTLNISDIDINLDVTEHISDNWFIQKTDNLYGKPNLVVMSQVAYEIPRNRDVDTKGFSNLVIKAPPGAVTFNPGRESLSLNKHTIEYLNKTFSDIAKEYVEAAHLKMSTATSDSELMSIYESVTNSAPSGIVELIDPALFASDSFKSLFSIPNSWYRGSSSTPTFHYLSITSAFKTLTNNLATANIKTQYYKHSKPLYSQNTVSYKEFFKATHVIIDVKSKFRAALNNHFLNKSLVSWSRYSLDVDIDLFVDKMKSFLSELGISYKLASDLIDTSNNDIQPKTTLREGFYANGINRSGIVCKAQELKEWNDPSQTFLFVDLKHSTPQLKHSDYLLTDYIDAYNILARQMDMPPVYGVAKKYKEFIANSDNWINFEDYLREKISTAVFYKNPDLNIRPLNKEHINVENIDQYPQPIIDYNQEALAYYNFIRSPNTISCESEMSIINNLGGTLLEYVPFKKIDMEALSTTYSLTFQSLRHNTSFTTKEIQHLGKLEHFYEIHSSQQR